MSMQKKNKQDVMGEVVGYIDNMSVMEAQKDVEQCVGKLIRLFTRDELESEFVTAGCDHPTLKQILFIIERQAVTSYARRLSVQRQQRLIERLEEMACGT